MNMYDTELKFYTSLNIKEVIKDVKASLTQDDIKRLKLNDDLTELDLPDLQTFVGCLSSDVQYSLSTLYLPELLYVLMKLQDWYQDNVNNHD